MFAISTVGEPGAHGAGIVGIQGMGVSTPRAAEVAAAGGEFVMLVHTPNGAMLAIGALSMMLAAAILSALVVGRITLRVLGATPNEH